MNPEEILKKKGITPKTKFHNYDYLYKSVLEAMEEYKGEKDKTKLEKYRVCNKCYSVGITDNNCMCTYGKFEPIVLEFEVCTCCGGLIEDGNPADTAFNNKQLKIED